MDSSTERDARISSDLAAPSTRSIAIASIIDGIRTVALPWFDGLQDLDGLSRRGRPRALPGIEDARLVILLLANDRRTQAEAFLRARRRPKREVYPELDALVRYHRLPRPRRG